MEGLREEIISQHTSGLRPGELSSILAEIHKTFQAVASQPEANLGLQILVEKAAQLLQSNLGALFLYKPDSQSVSCIASYSASGHPDTQISNLEDVSAAVAQSGVPVFTSNDPPQGNPVLPAICQFILASPLLWHGQVTGVLCVVHENQENHPPQHYLDLLSLFADQAAIVLENTHLMALERRRWEEAETVRRATAILTSKVNLNQVLESILDLLAQALTYDSVSIQLVDDTGILTLAAGRGFQDIEQTRQTVHQLSQHMLESKWSSHQAVVIPDTSQDARWKVIEGTEWIRSWVGAPLLVKGRLIGNLNLDSRTANTYNSTAAITVMAFANQAAIAIENARLFEKEARRVAELEAIRQVSLSITASLELSQVLEAILRSVLSLLPECSTAHIFLYAKEAHSAPSGFQQPDRLTFGAAMDIDGPMEHHYSPRSDGLTYQVARTGEVIVVPDMRVHPLYRNAPDVWYGSIIGLPLKIGNQVVGVMNIAYHKPREIPEADLRLLLLLGDQAAIAIQNAGLFTQAATEQRHLGLLYDIGQELTASLEVDEILDRAVTLTCQALKGWIATAYLYVPDEDRMVLRAIYGADNFSIDRYNAQVRFRPGIGLIGWVVQYGEVANIPDVSQDARWVVVPGLDDNICSVISAPIITKAKDKLDLVGRQILGVITVSSSQPHAFNDEHTRIMQAISQQVSLALSNARRYQQVQRRLAEITLIQNLAQTFNQRLELRILLDEVVTQLVQRLGYQYIGIYLLEGNSLFLRAHHGYTPLRNEIPLSEGVLGRVGRSGQAVFIPDVAKDPDYLNLRWEENLNRVTEIAVPILRGARVVGVINVENNQPGKLTLQDRDLLQVLADQTSVALENAFLYERVRRHADELEHNVAQRTAELTELYKLSQQIGYQRSYQELLQLVLHHLRAAVGSDLTAGFLMTRNWHALLIDTDLPIASTVIDHIRALMQDMLLGVSNLEPDDQPASVTPAELIDILETLPDLDTMPVLSQPPIQGEKEGGSSISYIASVIYAPVYVDKKLVGILLAACSRPDTFGPDEERLLTTLANQTASAVQHLSEILASQQKQLESVASLLVENIEIGTLLFDADFHLLVANPLGRRLLQDLNPGKVDRPLTNLGPCTLQELINRQDEHLETEIVLNENSRRVFSAQLRPVENRQWVMTLREVTRERELQARQQSQERLATVGQLAAGIAHDFNNIMAAIMVYSELLRSDPGIPATAQEKLLVIKQQVDRATSLIRQILDFSRQSVIEQIHLDLLTFIKELDKLLDRVMPETIRTELNYQPGDYWINADPTRMQLAFMNLAVNARDAMPEGGTIRFDLDRFDLLPGQRPLFLDIPPGAWIRVSVSDTGQGIAPDVRQHIFEPFFSTKPVGKGTGLGLAQVYGIIKKHGGYIDVQSQVGEGTTFILYLPASADPISTRIHPTAQFLPDKKPRGENKTVLVVEDDTATRGALQALLEAYNFQVIIASNGDEGFHKYQAAAEKIALVVCDVVMPQLGGLELYQRLKAGYPTIKVLFITGHSLDNDGLAMLSDNNRRQVRWLQKPFSVQDFYQAVQALLIR